MFVPLWQPASDFFLYACAYFEANKYDDDDDMYLEWFQRCGMQKNVQLFGSSSHRVVFYRAMLCIRGISHGPVSVCLSVSMSVSVTSRSSNKTAEQRIT